MILDKVLHGRIGASLNAPGTGIIIEVSYGDDEGEDKARAVLTKQDVGRFVDELRRLLAAMPINRPTAESEAKR